jgi:hypothetical protein
MPVIPATWEAEIGGGWRLAANPERQFMRPYQQNNQSKNGQEV